MSNVTIVGCGGIGGLAGFYMARAGENVLFVDQNQDHVRAIRDQGIFVNGTYGPMSVGPQAACTPSEIREPLHGLVFLSVKSQHTVAAAKGIAPMLGEDACVVSLQNGMNEDIIADIVGRARTMGAIPDYGGAYLNPGQLEAVHPGTVYVGELDGTMTPRVREAARLLGIGPNHCELCDDIVGRVWTKQVYNSQIVPTALVDGTAHETLGDRRLQLVAAVLVREALGVSDAAGVKLHADEWFDPDMYRLKTHADTERLLRQYDRLVEHLAGHQLPEKSGDYVYVKRASGIHWDIVYRKRKSEADYLTIAVVADRYGVQVPLNRRLVALINEIEDGRRQLGWHNVEDLAEYARSLGQVAP